MQYSVKWGLDDQEQDSIKWDVDGSVQDRAKCKIASFRRAKTYIIWLIYYTFNKIHEPTFITKHIIIFVFLIYIFVFASTTAVVIFK